MTQTRARQALRRLGRHWEYPDERIFAEEWFLGRIPSCPRCDTTVVMHVDIDKETPVVLCERCEDLETLEAKNSFYDMVLVEEAGTAYWGWYPEMSDAELESFWHGLPHINLSLDLDEYLPGDWYQLTRAGYWGQVEDMRRDFEHSYRTAYVWGDLGSYLVLPTKRHPHNADWRVYERQVVWHRGAPQRRRRRKR